MATMIKRVPLQTLVLGRLNKDGKRVDTIPEIGKAFEFTKDEIEQIERSNPDGLGVIETTDVTKPASTDL